MNNERIMPERNGNRFFSNRFSFKISTVLDIQLHSNALQSVLGALCLPRFVQTCNHFVHFFPRWNCWGKVVCIWLYMMLPKSARWYSLIWGENIRGAERLLEEPTEGAYQRGLPKKPTKGDYQRSITERYVSQWALLIRQSPSSLFQ